MTTLADNINAALSRSLCQGWDRNFLLSIQGKLEAGKTISKRQHEVLAQILDKCSDGLVDADGFAVMVAAHVLVTIPVDTG